ncbi:alpha/beta hydrolase [Pararhizobium haloflavum]|uniref:alpha/beta hydrolase n=1 Tax=Pararhizobium haloflavum TaxID=2037914 RepID=UPI000C1778BB|nr:alpha/beta-hydrolase family protein [Pararhizobium haloflavum]
MIVDLAARTGRSFSVTGLLLGTLFFAASLTPSLLPRTDLLQGVLSGCSFAAGYGVGVAARFAWDIIQLPVPPRRWKQRLRLVAAAACLSTAAAFLLQASEWQNDIRALMDLEPVAQSRPLQIGALAIAVFAVIVLLTRLVLLVPIRSSRLLGRYVPPRTAAIFGTIFGALALWSVLDGVVFRLALRAVDSSFQQLDALVEDTVMQPQGILRTGSDASLINWDEIGRAGRRFVASGPSRFAISSFTGDDAEEPIRVFVGLNSAETVEERATLALEELKRTGAFDRSLLVIVTPIGTGGIDAGAMNTLEYLHRGDVASVAVQYSYLTSWLSLLIEPGYGADTARALFTKIYEHWTNLPPNERPRLYLHGLSLGALNSDLSVDLYDIVADPIDGALWSGPPFSMETWRLATAERNSSSPAWLPTFRDGSVIRFANRYNGLARGGAHWGPFRIAFLQYGSDPVTFFEPAAFYRPPAWMEGARAADVSEDFRWFPVVTFLQLALDMANAVKTPVGYGHRYGAADYIDAWIALTEPEGWSAEEISELKERFRPPPFEPSVSSFSFH